jgi:hypothetical protein
MQFLNALSPLQWAVAAAVPIGVIALYFLKLKRKPVQVPSTYLWQKSIEDLHVNSLFQRLRRNLLLFLQLLILALSLLALARPAWFATQTGGQRHVIVIDNSASMTAADMEPTRLEWAKAQARSEVIDRMSSDDAAMIIAFNDSASVVCSYTSNRQVLRERLASIELTQRTTNLREALDVAAGLANPQSFSAGARSTDAKVELEDIPAAELHLFTDGGFADVRDFSLGNLRPHFYPVGESSSNVAVVSMMVRRNDEYPDSVQVFARLLNFAGEPMAARTELYLDGDLKDAKEIELPARDAKEKKPGEKAVAFDLAGLDQGVLQLRLDAKDALGTDNVAWCVVGNVRHAKVLALTDNAWLKLALATGAARDVADVELLAPSTIDTDEYKQKASSGQYDLIVYDACAPELMPPSNTLFFGAVPKVRGLGEVKTLVEPVIVEVNDAHPLFRFVNMENVAVIESLLPELPQGTEKLMESGEGPLAFLLAREGFRDCVVGFGFERETPDGRRANTDWMVKRSFPMFVYNSLRVLGNVDDAVSEDAVLPGQTVMLRSESLADERTIKNPKGESRTVKRSPQGSFLYNQTDQVGVYEFGDGAQTERRFAINLFDQRESDIAPRQELQIGHNPVVADAKVSRAQKEFWRWLVLAALAVLLGEWYIYNRRVYI